MRIRLLAAFLTSCAIVCTGCGQKADSASKAPPAGPLTPKQELAAAFAAAFPNGPEEVQGDRDYKLTFGPERLVPVNADGTRVALISTGFDPNNEACHACAGKLRITYLARDGNSFALTRPAIQTDVDGNGFGNVPEWKVVVRSHLPAVWVKTDYTEQGCVTTASSVYLLKPEPEGVLEDKRAAKGPTEDCSANEDAPADAAPTPDAQPKTSEKTQ